MRARHVLGGRGSFGDGEPDLLERPHQIGGRSARLGEQPTALGQHAVDVPQIGAHAEVGRDDPAERLVAEREIVERHRYDLHAHPSGFQLRVARIGGGGVVRAGRNAETQEGQRQHVAQRIVADHENRLGQRYGGERAQQVIRGGAHDQEARASGVRFHPAASSTDDANASM